MGQFSFPCRYNYSGHLRCALVHVAEQEFSVDDVFDKDGQRKEKIRGAEKLREKQEKKMETDAAKCETLIVRAAAPSPAVPPTLLTNPGGST